MTILEERVAAVRMLAEERADAIAAEDWDRVQFVERHAPRYVLEADGYEAWLAALFPTYTSAPLAAHHHEFWQWVWSVQAGVSPDVDPVNVWNRGGAKSMSMELALVAMGAMGVRSYALYVCNTQDRANDHVGVTISELFESPELARIYPTFSRRLVSEYGVSRGWRINRLRTGTGFTIDAIGLDKAVRGVKLGRFRPDIIVLDDIDEPHDTEATTRKKVTSITRGLLPSGAPHLAVMAGQNLIHPTGVFARLAGMLPPGTPFSELLHRRRVSGPIPAVDGLVIARRPDPAPEREGQEKATIIAGRPTWEGLPVEALQAELDRMGETAFRAEYQHEVHALEGAMYEKVLPLVQRLTVDGVDALRELVGTLTRTTVWCDPAVTNKAASDAHGVQADGMHADGTIYRLRSWEQRGSPRDTVKRAIGWAFDLGSDHVGIETDQGGDTWYDTFAAALREYLEENPELLACVVCHQPAERHAVQVPVDVVGLDPIEHPEACPGYLPRPVPTMLDDKAGYGHGPKQERSARMLADYERPGNRIVHVYGYPDDSTALDAALGRVFIREPFDLADAAYWSWYWLRQHGEGSTGADAAAAVGRVRRR